MVKSNFWKIGNVTVGAGFSFRLGIGICIERYGLSLDVGPFWVFIEW